MDVEQVEFITWKSCLRKQNLSEEVANRIVDQAAAKGNLIYFYKCELCSSFHITKQVPMAEDKKRLKFS